MMFHLSINQSNSRESESLSLRLDLRKKHNDFGNILPWFLSSTSQICGTNTDDPTSLEFKDMSYFGNSSVIYFIYVKSKQFRFSMRAVQRTSVNSVPFRKGMSLLLDSVFIFGIIFISSRVLPELHSIFCCASCGALVCYCVALVPSSGNKWSSHLTSALIYSFVSTLPIHTHSDGNLPFKQEITL